MAAFSANDMNRDDEDPRASAAAPATPAGPASTRMATLAEAAAGLGSTQAMSPIVLGGLVRLAEFLIVAATGFLVHSFYVGDTNGTELQYFVSIGIIAAATLLIFQAFDLNHVAAMRAPLANGLRVMGGWSLVFLAAMAVQFFLKLEGTYSRVWLVSWFALGLAVLLAERLVLSLFVRHLTRTGRLDRRTVIVGGGAAGEQLLHDLSEQVDSDLRIYGVFDDRTDDRAPDVVAGYPKLGNIDDLVEFARHTRLDLVIFTLPISAEHRLLQMLRKLWVLPIDIRLAAHMNKLRFRPRSYSYIGSVPVLDMFDKPIADWDIVLKAGFDRIAGALLLVLASPVMLAIAIAVKATTKGPVLFKQKRYGFNNELIEIYKFRSMYDNLADNAGVIQATRGDPRVTKVGRFIRKTSLDELPQLFNVVFKGDLSLVGPRPHAVHAKAADRMYDDVVDGYFARHRVRPGITGWAQVNGWRGETDTPEKIQGRVEHDLYYIENWSILFDAYIVLVTPLALIKAENAY